MVDNPRASIWKVLFTMALVVMTAVAAVPVVADVGDAVLQGKINRVDKKTTLIGEVAGDSMLRVTNTGAGGTGVTVQVDRGNPPLKVNTSKRVKKLNADFLDGFSSEAFVKAQDAFAGEGVILVSVSDSGWRPLNSQDPVEFDWSGNTDLDVSRTTPGTNWFNNDGDIPTVMYGRSVQFNGLEFCYDATAPNVSFSAIQIDVTTNSNGEPTFFTPILEFTSRNDAACRVYLLDTPAVLNAQSSLQVWIQGNWSGTGILEMGRLTMIFEPTDVAAPAPAGEARMTPDRHSPTSPATTD